VRQSNDSASSHVGRRRYAARAGLVSGQDVDEGMPLSEMQEDIVKVRLDMNGSNYTQSRVKSSASRLDAYRVGVRTA